MPVKRPGLSTGVPSAQIVKAAAQERTMSQNNDIDLELAALEAELQEEQMQATQPAVQEDAPVSQDDVDAELAALGTQGGDNEDVDAGLAKMSDAQEEEMQEEPSAEPEPEPAEVAAPTSEPAAAEPAPSVPAPANGSGSGATATKQPQLGLKRKPGLMVKKAETKPAPAAPAASAKPAAAAPTSGPKPVAKKPSVPAGLVKKTVKARPVQPAEDEASPAAPASVGEALAAVGAATGVLEKENEDDNASGPSKPCKPAKPAAVPNSKAPVVPKAKPATKPAAAAAGAEGGIKIKKPSNAYMFFATAKRSEVKTAHPDLAFGALNAKLGELYKAQSPEEKAPYEEQAAADKQRYQAEVAAAGGAAAVAAAKPKVKRTKSAYQLFCDERLPLLRADNPQAGLPEISKLVSAEWKALSAEDRAPYDTQAQALKTAAKAAAGSSEAGGEAAPAEKKKRARAASTIGGSRKKAKGSKAAAAEEEEEGKESTDDADDEMDSAQAAAGKEEDEEDDEAERMACDWEAHPAECILSQTATGKYVVLRRGLGLTEYGLVDAAAVKAQRLGGQAGAAPCPVTLAQLNEYEAFLRTFKKEVHACDEGGELVLDDLPGGSLLECCFFLGKLREPTYELAKASKNDGMMKVPIMATSRVVHRLLMAERQRCQQKEAAWAAEREALLAQLGAAGRDGAGPAKADAKQAAVEEAAGEE